MGCRNQGSPCEESDHCTRRRPQAVSSSAGVSTEYTEYPVTKFRAGNYNIPKRTANAVMHDSIFVPKQTLAGGGGTAYSDGGSSGSVGNCGKLRYTGCATGFFGAGDYVYDYYPNELSFDWQSSDTWIAYLFDTSGTPGAGGAGQNVYYIERCTDTSTTPASGTPGQPGYSAGTSESTSSTSCLPCSAHTCTPANTDVKYTYGGQNLTNDPDCPFPDLFGIGTQSTKIVFSYNSLSTTLPNGVTDVALSYNGATFVDVYDETLGIGSEYNSTQNPWQTGEETFSTFEIYDEEVFDSETKSGFRVKVQIEPIMDETQTPAVFTGTKWTLLELMNPGSGYSVGEVYTLNYNHTHPDLTETTFTVDLKFTSIGPVQITQGQEGFDVLRTNDTLNGHKILRVYHTDLDNFPYHVAYLSGTGSDFEKDTQYTSSRNHIITAKAGYGIADRACLVGRYEFTEKSIQYVTASIDKNSPDVYNDVVLPEADATVTNGKITSFTITKIGANLTQAYLNGEEPILIVTGSPSENGQDAEVEGIFIGGQLSDIKIISGGTLYDANDPPKIYISNTYKKATTKYSNAGYEPGKLERYAGYFDAYPGQEDPGAREDFNASADTIPKDVNFTTIQENIDIKFDSNRKKADVLPQSLYSKDKTDPLVNILVRDVDNTHLNDFKYREMARQIFNDERDRKDRIRKSIDDITQEQIPEYNVTPEVLVETVQGRLGDLPYSSQYTKYILKQYRPDPTERATIQVTLSCSPTEPGINTDICPPPAASAPTSGSSTDPETGIVTTTSRSCTVAGPYGPGCKAWEAKGSMLFLHDITRSAANVVAASKAFGNPLLQT